MNPTAAEMLKHSPASFSAQTPPMPMATTLASTTSVSSQLWNARYRNSTISTSDRANIFAIRRSASSICLNSPLHSAR